MFGKKVTETDLIKERIAQHLRTADYFVKEGKYDNALLEIDEALRLDPKNLFARSFLERVRYLIEGAQKEKRMTEKNSRHKRPLWIAQPLRILREVTWAQVLGAFVIVAFTALVGYAASLIGSLIHVLAPRWLEMCAAVIGMMAAVLSTLRQFRYQRSEKEMMFEHLQRKEHEFFSEIQSSVDEALGKEIR